MGRKYDFVIYGASGFTGKCTVLELVKLLKEKKIKPVTWAVAGRSGTKLKEVLKEVSGETGEDLSGIEIIEADVEKPESLQAMARECNVLITCVGPYRFFGEPVIKACIAEGTNCVDVSGEPQYLEKIQLLYHKEALEKNIYIVGSCGMDSVPADCGVALMQEKFEGDLSSVEMFLEFENKGAKPAKLNFATWQSAIYGLAHAAELRSIRKELFQKPLPKPSYKLPERGTLHYSDIVKGWCLPFPGADRSVVKRSQYYFFQEEKKRPAQMTAYFKAGSLFSSLVLIFVGLIFGVFAQFKAGRYLLEHFPGFFSFGFVTKEGPSKDEMNDAEFRITLRGEGWQEKLTEPSDQHSEPPNKKMTVVVSGRNPAYGATCIMVIQAAYTILKEADKMPSKGGVYAPGAAFAKTTFIERLNASGVTFTIQDSA